MVAYKQNVVFCKFSSEEPYKGVEVGSGNADGVGHRDIQIHKRAAHYENKLFEFIKDFLHGLLYLR